MCPSGNKPFGNNESSTNSGSVSSSSLDRTNLVPLRNVSLLRLDSRDLTLTYLKSIAMVSSAPTSAALLAPVSRGRDVSPYLQWH